MSDLSELARKFPESLVKQKPGAFKAAYVEHSVVVQRLLETVGPFDFTVDKPITNPDGVVSGCLATLSCWIDGDYITITEVGDVEHPGPNNGSNLKNASSDALKRCAARIGLGTHLWSGENYYLDKALKKREDAAEKAAADE
jgi:hypothetical protein